MNVFGKKSKNAYIGAFISGAIILATCVAFVIVIIVFDIVRKYNSDTTPTGFLFILVPVLMAGLALLCFRNGYKVLRLPNDLITADAIYLYLAVPAQKINIKDIETISPLKSDTDYTKIESALVKYGTIIVTTKTGERFSQRYVGNVVKVSEELNAKVLKNQMLLAH